MYVRRRKSDRNKVLIMVVSLLIGMIFGAMFFGGYDRSEPISDYDSIAISPAYTYVGDEANIMYFEITGSHFNDTGNIFDRYTRQDFNVAELEVNRFTYSIYVTDENTEIYFVRFGTSNDTLTVVDQVHDYGNVTGQILMGYSYDISVLVFYGGVRVVSITGFFDYV